MGARIRSRWLKIKRPRSVIGIIAASVMVIALIVGIIGGYLFNWNWTGLSRKTLWDWLQLLIIPLVLAVIALLFNRATTRTEQKIAAERYEQDKTIASRHYHQDRQIAEQRYKQDQQIALDKQHEDLLQAYLDRISELLLKEGLRTSPSEEARNVARVRTITALTQLNARRIGYVFTFLREAGLMSTTSNDNVVSLRGADLHAVNWSHANLSGVNLSGANLRQANLIQADLRKANLSGALLDEAVLSKADLSEAVLSGATLNKANLSHAYLRDAALSEAVLGFANLSKALLRDAALSEAVLSGANLSGALLDEVDLSEANLSGADLSHAYLGGANLSGALLDEVDLSGANLSGAVVTAEQLKEAKSLKGATMPDGSIHP